jgi:hypothetical protein
VSPADLILKINDSVSQLFRGFTQLKHYFILFYFKQQKMTRCELRLFVFERRNGCVFASNVIFWHPTHRAGINEYDSSESHPPSEQQLLLLQVWVVGVVHGVVTLDLGGLLPPPARVKRVWV